MTTLAERFPTVAPTERDRSLARDSGRRLSAHLAAHHGLRVQVEGPDARGETLELPESAMQLLGVILAEMAQGNAVTLIPVHAELTTQQAADYLNVSRPFLVNLLESGQLPFHKVGTHRRVNFQHLAEYKKQTVAARLRSLDKLAELSQEMGLEY